MKNAPFWSMRDLSPESLYWSTVAKRWGYDTRTIRDSYTFARDKLQVVEPELSLKSIKWSYLFDVKFDNSIPFSDESWDRLFTNFDDALARAFALQDKSFTVREFFSRKIG